ncbi:BTB/POZ and MATH domain-containing protein 4-like [Miscanthus floridulus]|uniref:BTB/POZ and MATH domain-containing protein 4-like n=1 Tax=Miscanthus floridulus TaxID=154761 RepID=UPI0034598F81
MRVTRTARGTHVAHVRGVSRLQEQQCGVGGGGFVDSPAFAVAGLRSTGPSESDTTRPGSDGEHGHVGIFVMLLTEGVVAPAYVGLLLLDQTSGLPDTVIWDQRPTRFDATSADWCTRGTGQLATRSELKGSRFVRGDCLRIECVIDVCRDQIAR